METIEIDKARLEVINKLVLAKGSHGAFEAGACAMEAVSFLAGEPHSDAPKCASIVLRKFVIGLNDRWGEEQRQALKPYLIRLVGTAAPLDIEKKRAFICADWAIRECLPIWLDAAKLSEWSGKLQGLPEIIDKATAENGRKMAQEARTEVRKKYPADADAAAYADAAYAAAYADADAAAAYAADAAAYADADAAAAYAADAADARAKANASALSLIDRLIAVKPGPFDKGVA